MRVSASNISSGAILRRGNFLSPEKEEGLRSLYRKTIASLGPGLRTSFSGHKLHIGELSPGCVSCAAGRWSCLFINSLCTRNCFFCPQDRTIKKETPAHSQRLLFSGPREYIRYLKRFGFRDVGFSGGEPFLVFDRLLDYLRCLRQEMGAQSYIWMYTNGDLLDQARLDALAAAGLNEIRFNISARGYELAPALRAAGRIQKITVEIPAVPEDLALLKKVVRKMARARIDFLNLHQLQTTSGNFERYRKRKYTLLRQDGFPVAESEAAALETLRYCLDARLELRVNYCSCAYKNQVQLPQIRKRIAKGAGFGSAQVTAAGFVREFFTGSSRRRSLSLQEARRRGNAGLSCNVEYADIRLYSRKNDRVPSARLQKAVFFKELQPCLLKYFNEIFVCSNSLRKGLEVFSRHCLFESGSSFKRTVRRLADLLRWEQPG